VNLLTNRLHKLRALIAEKDLDALLISQRENCRYLSGFTGSTSWLLISYGHTILATDFRYVEQAKQESQNFEIIQIKGQIHDWLPDLAYNSCWHKLGFAANHISVATYRQLNETIKAKQLNLELTATTGLVEGLRCIKDADELESIVKAAQLTDAAFKQAKLIIQPGVTEREAAWEIEKSLRQSGSEGVAFDVIVASGPTSALPHANPSEKTIRQNEPVLIDMGARVGGYCSDFSRTFCLGEADEVLSKVYNVVLEAQLTGIQGIKSGMTAAQADRLARDVIEQAGYSSAFGHGLGHGVGLEVHESPRLAPDSSDLLTDGMVFTIEPGIYIPGFGGVRIEDMVVLENGRLNQLTKSPKDMEVFT